MTRNHAWCAAIALCLVGSAAHAADPDRALKTARARISAAATDVPTVESAIASAVKAEQRKPEQRIADAVLLMGVKDYDRAIDVLNEVTEKHRAHPTAFPDALQLLGEAYFKDKQLLSARRSFALVLSRSGERRFAPFQERAVLRLVDVALRRRQPKELDAVFAKLAMVPAVASSGIAYAKGKGLFAQGKFDGARASLMTVPLDSNFAHQARYLLGTIAVRMAAGTDPAAGKERYKPVATKLYAPAIQLFRGVTRIKATTSEQRHVVGLANLAIGRLLYESGDWAQAVTAYNQIKRESPEFGTMLYELAWVYVRLGDVMRAMRALEVLSVAAPNSDDVADAALLRGDLMLRAGQFEKSFKVYESVRGNYDRMRSRVDGFLGKNTDAGVFFDMLSRDQLELFEAGGTLPPLVVRWARKGTDGDMAFAVIDDVTASRRLIKESNEMIDRLNAVLASPNRIRAVPALRVGAERALGLINSVALARMRLAKGLDEFSVSGQLLQLRRQRKAYERRLKLIPVDSADFSRRETQANRQWNRTSQGLQRLELEIDTLQATVNGLERMLRDGPQAGVVRSPAQVESYRMALVEQRRLIFYYREQVTRLRSFTEAGKIQVGFGDRRFVEDARVRAAYRQLVVQEVALAQRDGGELRAYAARAAEVLAAADAVDARLGAIVGDIDRTVRAKTKELRKAVSQETAHIVDYSGRLEQLDEEARMVVGQVAMRNFINVRDRLKSIVLRADVGITEEAWELREEQLMRVRRLKVERARTDARLERELEEVLDDSGEPEE
ncbi:MAG: tetratricopeptide repeat protein [Polyangiaceae bacterium]